MKIFGNISRLLGYLIFVSVFVLLNYSKANCEQKFNQIVNLFHHKGSGAGINNGANNNVNNSNNLSKDAAQALNYNLELGNLVFYFEQKPVVNFVPEREKDGSAVVGTASKVFIFPYAQIKDDKLINKTNSDVGFGYKLKIERVNNPIKGVKLTFLYEPDKVSLDYKFFDSIGNHKGVVFNFYNKNLIDKLKHIDDRVLKTVYNNCDIKNNIKSYSKKKIVVVDFGHGGDDYGAIGKFGLNEKDVTLSIGRQVRDILKKKGFDVFLTRDCDKTVSLDERTSYANNYAGNYLNNLENNCDDQKILLSIHANSALNGLSSGLETFCLDNSLFQDGVFFYDSSDAKLAENCLRIRNKDSFLLASNLHQNVYNFIKQCDGNYKNRGVKKSVSQLLLGSHMPAVLIEVGFLSNDQDANFLKSLENQQVIAKGICEGIVEYFEHKAR